jgi:hypothetical protein
MAKLRVASTIVDLIHDNVRAANPSDERMSLIVPARPGRKLVRRTGRVHHTQHLSRERITNVLGFDCRFSMCCRHVQVMAVAKTYCVRLAHTAQTSVPPTGDQVTIAERMIP